MCNGLDTRSNVSSQTYKNYELAAGDHRYQAAR